jgi:hypothetical protein
MSMFSKPRSPGDIQQTGAALAPQQGVPAGQPAPRVSLTPPFVPPGAAPRSATAPGVVPPPAAPMYTPRPPEPARGVLGDTVSSATANVTLAREAQRTAEDSVRERVEVSLQRARTAAVVRRRPALPAPAACAPLPQGRQPFDPVARAQYGLLSLAWSWHQAGAPIRAIHTYMQLLSRYPGTPAAAAAVADLVELSDSLAKEGQFHTALSIYEQLEELV